MKAVVHKSKKQVKKKKTVQTEGTQGIPAATKARHEENTGPGNGCGTQATKDKNRQTVHT